MFKKNMKNHRVRSYVCIKVKANIYTIAMKKKDRTE